MSAPSLFRICFVSPWIYPLFNSACKAKYSDAEIQLYELARYLSQDEDVEVSVVTGNYGQDEIEYYSGVLVYRSDFDCVQPWHHRAMRRLNSFHKLLHSIDPDICMMAGADGLVYDVAQYCRRKKAAFLFRISHQRDCDGTYVHAEGENGDKYRNGLKLAHTVFCQTEKQRRLIQGTEKIDGVVIPNALPMSSTREEQITDVIWIGEAAEWRQPELFFRLALTVPNSTFTMLARPYDGESFAKLVSKTRDVPNLGFENSVPYHELPSFMGKAKILVNTSRYEGYPISFAQAFSYGMPVVSLNVDPDSILEKKQIGIHAAGSEVRMAQGVMDLLAYQRQLNHYSDNALKYAKEFVDIKRVAELYRTHFLTCKSNRRKW